MDYDKIKMTNAKLLKDFENIYDPIAHQQARKMVAQHKMLSYREYISAGFTAEQAFQLVLKESN